MTAAFERLPVRPGREAAFEPLLDGLLPVFCPGWKPPPAVAAQSGYQRCEIKRLRIGRAAGADPDKTRRYAAELMRAAVHDQCRSGIRQLVRPLVRALGYRRVGQSLIEYIRTGTDAEKTGAVMAWYWAYPTLVYASLEAGRLREPTRRGRAAVEVLAELRRAYRAACLTAFLEARDPGLRQDLSLGFTLDPADYRTDQQRRVLEQARRIVNADLARYGRIPAAPRTSPPGDHSGR